MQPSTRKILLIEDEPMVARALKRMLRTRLNRYTIISAATLKEARTLWAQYKHEILLVLSDTNLPDGLGSDFHRSIAGDLMRYRVGFVGMTGAIERNSATAQYYHAVGVPYLEKPFKPSEAHLTILEQLTSQRRWAMAVTVGMPPEQEKAIIELVDQAREVAGHLIHVECITDAAELDLLWVSKTQVFFTPVLVTTAPSRIHTKNVIEPRGVWRMWRVPTEADQID